MSSLCVPREGWDPLPFNSKPDGRDPKERRVQEELLWKGMVLCCEPQGEDCEIPASCLMS